MAEDKTLYDADSIQSLDARSHIRLRSGMYIGDNATPNQLLLEVFSNSLDEYNIGHGKRIVIELLSDNSVRVVDEGQGFPINEMRDDGKSVFEAAFSVINTSGKFSDDGVYGGSALGLNGVGAKIANFLSSEFWADTYNNGRKESIHFRDGLLVSREVHSCAKGNHGTAVKYIPDSQFFGTGKTDAKYFLSFFQDISCLCPGLEIIFNDCGEIYDIKSENGIADLIESRVKDRQELIQNRFVYSGKNFDVAMTFTEDAGVVLLPYVNYGYTDSGPHITGLKTTITRVFNSWAKERGILKAKDKNIDGASLQEGLVLALNLVSTGVSYNAQTKEKIVKCDTSFLDDFSTQLEVWLDNNPDDGRTIIEKALIARRAAEAAKKAREAVKQKAAEKTKKIILPSKLADCHSKNRMECEIYVTEGDSASGGAKLIRNASTQAVLGLRGKVLNCLVATPRQIMKNAEVVDIIKALGFDYEFTEKNSIVHYDKEKLRYGKFIIAADRDSDGSHIQLLVLALLWKLVPQLIKDGYVYIALPPLYKAEWGTKYKYLQDKQELEDFSKNHKDFQLTYFKGLGEASPEELGAMIIDPATRQIAQVNIEDVQVANQIIYDLMGADSEPKKKFVFGEE